MNIYKSIVIINRNDPIQWWTCGPGVECLTSDPKELVQIPASSTLNLRNSTIYTMGTNSGYNDEEIINGDLNK